MGKATQGRKKETNEDKRKRKAANKEIHDMLKWVLPITAAVFLSCFALIYFYASRPIPDSLVEGVSKLD
ncbi:hypothetical protein WJX77_009809 [Trebouxia sp. C0004]